MRLTRRSLLELLGGFFASACALGFCGCKTERKKQGGEWADVDSPLLPTIKNYAVSIHVSSDGWPIERVIWSDRFGMVRRKPVDPSQSWEISGNAWQSRLKLIGHSANPLVDGDCLPWDGSRNG